MVDGCCNEKKVSEPAFVQLHFLSLLLHTYLYIFNAKCQPAATPPHHQVYYCLHASDKKAVISPLIIQSNLGRFIMLTFSFARITVRSHVEPTME
jgi:hypothetical protein